MLWINIGVKMGFDFHSLITTAVVMVYLYLQHMKVGMEQSIFCGSEQIATHFDHIFHSYEQAFKCGYPRCGFLGAVIYICYLGTNLTFMLIGSMGDGDVIFLAGLYGILELFWEVIGLEPNWTRRKIICF